MKLLIVHPEGNIKNNPNLYYFCKELVKIGFEIKIFSRYREDIYQGELFQGAELVYFTGDRLKNHKIKKQLLAENFNFVIGVDEGLIEAEFFAKAMGVPYAFLSYEILFDNELKVLNNPTDIKNKQKTADACKNIHFAIVQDEVREKILSEEYQIDKEKVLLMPVAGTGIKKLDKTNYFHKKLDIPSDKKILLYMGWMDDLQLKRLSEFSAYVPENWVLVIHSRYKYNGEIPDGFRRDKIYLSFDSPIENMDDMGILLSSVDAGFCSYEPTYKTPFTGDNIKYIGLSSGKASTFLQYGVSLVIENMNIWDTLVVENNIGILLETAEDLKKLNTLENTSEACYLFFEKHLDLMNFAPQIIKKIEESLLAKGNKNVIPFYFEEYIKVSKFLIKRLFNKTK